MTDYFYQLGKIDQLKEDGFSARFIEDVRKWAQDPAVIAIADQLNEEREENMSRVATRDEVAVAFEAAVTSGENINEDGSMNWCFVDADVCMDLGEARIEMPADYLKLFEALADEFEAAQ